MFGRVFKNDDVNFVIQSLGYESSYLNPTDRTTHLILQIVISAKVFYAMQLVCVREAITTPCVCDIQLAGGVENFTLFRHQIDNT